MAHITRYTAKIGLFAGVALALALGVAAAPASARQRVVTWNLRSKYISKTQALVGLTGPDAVAAGPTGLRSWAVLPTGYKSTRCYPVVYLLHAAGAPDEWVNQLAAYQDSPVIFVIPGGGQSQYSNWWNNGARSPEWENWFFDEFIPKVSRSLPICPGRRNHAIAGSSMGGFGAMYLASQRPDYFGAAASFSGVIAISDRIIEYGFSEYANVWGPISGFYELGHDPTYLLPTLKHTRLFVYVGNGTPLNPVSTAKLQGGQLVESVMRHEASVFLAAANRDHVPVRFEEHGGIHTQDNWNLSLAHFMADDPFARVATDPKTWAFTTTAETGQAWGFQYTFTRPPSTLETLSYANGVLHGTGQGTVKLVSPGGQRFTAKMPFSERGGVVRPGHGKVPVYRAKPLPIVLTLSAAKLRRRDALHVKFKARALSPGHSYELSGFQYAPGCTINAISHLGPTKPGRSKTFVLRADTLPGHPRNRWCKGPGVARLLVVPTNNVSDQIGDLVGQVGFQVH